MHLDTKYGPGPLEAVLLMHSQVNGRRQSTLMSRTYGRTVIEREVPGSGRPYVLLYPASR